MAHSNNSDLQLIRPAELAELLSVSIPTLYRMMKEPGFPKKVKISSKAVGFRRQSVIEWMEKNTENKNGAEVEK